MNKKEMRKFYKEIRKNIEPDRKKEESERICNELVGLIREKKCSEVLLYAPLAEEVDIMGVFNDLTNEVKMYFPRVSGEYMDFYSVENTENLHRGTFGVYEPNDDTDKIEFSKEREYLMIVPGIAFDKRGYRIGYGKGYYDKYLSSHNSYNIYKVGVCFEECVLEEIPYDEYDKKVDMILF